MKEKHTYRVRNWSEYNKSLKQRGSLDIWLSEESLKTWFAKKQQKNGRSYIFSQAAITTLLMIRRVFRLPLRQTEGFIASVLKQQGIPIRCPSYSTLSRRMSATAFFTQKQASLEEKLHITIDSTGIKIYGDGEWKRKKHGIEKQRKWKKLHIAINDKGELKATDVTNESVYDAHVAEAFLKYLKPESFHGDGAYDQRRIYELCSKYKIRPSILPRKSAVPWNTPYHPRNRALLLVKRYGRAVWKKISHYTKRSRVESVMWRCTRAPLVIVSLHGKR